MKYTLIIIITSFTLVVNSQNCYEPLPYMIEGYMYTLDGTPIPNDTFLLYNNMHMIVTDNEGRFSDTLYVKCSNDVGYKIRKYLNLVNPKYLVFVDSNHRLYFVKNKWKKYMKKNKVYKFNVYWPIFYRFK